MTEDDAPMPPGDPYRDLRRQVRALIAEWRFEPATDAWARSFDHAFSRELGARHLLGISWPVSVGGGGRSFQARLAVTEELLRAGAPVNAHWFGERQVGPAVFRTGTARLQQEILPGILSGDSIFCIGMSEPDAGSDLAAVRTAATRTTGGWLLNGRKIWTTNAHRATHAYVLARTDKDAPKHAGLSELILDMGTPGIEVAPILDMSGEHHFNEVVFEDVFVPAHRLLGQEGNGWAQVVDQLSFERGGPERVLSSYPLLARLRGRLGGADSGILAELGRLTARLAALRRLCWEITAALDEGRAPVREAATLKYLGTRFERDVIEFARSADFTDDRALFEQTLLASPSFTIRGGALEVLLGLIAKSEARA